MASECSAPPPLQRQLVAPTVKVPAIARDKPTAAKRARGRRFAYLVVPAEGSPAIRTVEHAVDAGPQRVRVTVSGTGARRALRWSVTPTWPGGSS
jgi:hypothetical protein